MRKLIDFHQEFKIICDNPKCDYKIKNDSGDININISEFINKPCPNCRENLLTEKDNDDFNIFIKIINNINKYFGWLSFLFGTKSLNKPMSIHIYNGVTINS